MNVRKRNGSLEPINLEKIVKAVTRSARGITDVDPARVAAKTIGGIYDGATTQELDKLSIETAASLIPEHSNYSKLALPRCVGWLFPSREEKK
jgi:ribonucleoside-diphosphate reductase alpha chain